MARTGRRWRGGLATALLGTVVAIALVPGPAAAQDAPATPTLQVDGPVPTAAGMRGGPVTAARRPLADRGYVEQEWFFGGTADVHREEGTWGEDGRWATAVQSSSPYRTRMLVRRPIDPSRFNGNVVVSWLNVDGTFDNDVEWALAADELMREGTVFVGVSAQYLGVHGLMGAVLWDPARYRTLGLPDDGLSYDVFTQAGRILKDPGGVDPLDGLSTERRLIASGHSQSAQRLVTYLNAFHPVAKVYDGFVLLSRFAGAAPLGAATDPNVDPDAPDPLAALLAGPSKAKVRDDTDVPVFVLVTETELRQNDAVRRADSDLYRTWEVAGSSHLDATVLAAQKALAKRDFPLAGYDPAASCRDPNAFPTAYAVRAAFRAVGAWVADGEAPPTAPRIARETSGAITRDDDGNAVGGLRLPDIEVPTASHSGESEARRICGLVGSSVPFTAEALAARYPDADAYADQVTEAAEAAVDAGFLLPEDAQPMVTAAHRSVGGTAQAAAAAVASAAGETATASPRAPAGSTGPAASGSEAGEAAASAPDAATAERSDPSWMAKSGRDLITPVLIGLLLLLNGRVVLTIANQRRSGR